MAWENDNLFVNRRNKANLNDRSFSRLSVGNTSLELEVMIFTGRLREKTPLVIVNSIEFPVPPSLNFCDAMWSIGYQVIFIRRLGFGKLRGLPDALVRESMRNPQVASVTEVALLKQALDTMGLQNVTLMGSGTSNSICFRLAQVSSKVEFTVFTNPLFHPAIWSVIRPAWLRRMIRQTVKSKSGLKIAVRGLRAILRRDPLWFYKQFAQKSAGDLAYVAENERDFYHAGLMLQRIEPETFYYDLKMSLIEDTKWNSSACSSLQAVILAGAETTQPFRAAIKQEAHRLGLPIEFAPSGDLFVPYASPDVLSHLLLNRKLNYVQARQSNSP